VEKKKPDERIENEKTKQEKADTELVFVVSFSLPPPR
jgi:hypothetical protein